MQNAPNYAGRYAAMSDGELADFVSGGLDSLNEEARSAFQAELRKRGVTSAELREQYPVEQSSSEDKGGSRASLLQEFGVLGIPVAAVLVLVLYVVLAGKPFGLQFATLVAYTGYVFFPLFCNLRGSKGFDLRQRSVRKMIPRLLGVHMAFLAIVFIGLTAALALRPSLPPSWIMARGRRDASWFDLWLLLIGLVTCMFQVHICRKLLSRSVAVAQAN